MSTKIERHDIWDRYFIVLSLYPKKFGYSLGGYSHRERCRAPDRKKLEKEKNEKAAMKELLKDA
jgi:hypothetical protein